MSNFHFLKKDLEWKIVKTQCPGPTAHIPHNPQTLHFLSWETRSRKNYILLNLDRVQCRQEHPSPLSVSSLYSFKRENTLSWEARNEWQIEIWVPTILAPLHHTHRLIFSLEQQLKRENYTPAPTPLYTLPGNSRNEWQIDIWVTNHFKILYPYYTWTLSWTTYYLTTQNNPDGEKNNSAFSIALDDPSSILMKRLCIFAPTIIHISFLILILCNAHPHLSTMITREKRILIWLLINYLIKLTN
jgi:hypothetical protein